MSSDHDAIAELAQVWTPGARHLLRHYLYLPDEAGAAAVAAELTDRGFNTEKRLGADGVNWLVLAWHELVPTVESVLATRQLIEALISVRRGEYDGWEVEIA